MNRPLVREREDIGSNPAGQVVLHSEICAHIPMCSYLGVSAMHRQVHRGNLKMGRTGRDLDCPPSALMLRGRKAMSSSETSRHFPDRPWEGFFPVTLKVLLIMLKVLGGW